MKHLLVCVTALLLAAGAAMADFTENFDSYATGPLSAVSGGVWHPWMGGAVDAEVAALGLSAPNAMKNTGIGVPEVVTYFANGLGFGMTATFSFDFLVHEEGGVDSKAWVFAGAGGPGDYSFNYDAAFGGSFEIDEGQDPGVTTIRFAGAVLKTDLAVDQWHHVELVALQTVEHVTSNGAAEIDGVLDIYVNSEKVVSQRTFTLNDKRGFNALDMYADAGADNTDDYFLFDNISVVFAPAPPPQATSWTSAPNYAVWPGCYYSDQGQPFSDYSTLTPAGPPYLVTSNGWTAIMSDIPDETTGYLRWDIRPAATSTGQPLDLTGSMLHFTLRWDSPPNPPSELMGVWVRAYNGTWDGSAWTSAGQSAWFVYVPIDKQWHDFVKDTSLPEYVAGTPDLSQVFLFIIHFVYWEPEYSPGRMGIRHFEARYPSDIDLPMDATGSDVGVEPRDVTDTVVKIAFDKPMETLSPNAVEIVGVTNTTPVYPALAVDPQNPSVVLATVPGGLPNNDRYTATIVDSLLDMFGHDILDGTGYDLDVEFYVLHGDALGGVDVDLSDYAKFMQCFNGFLNNECFRADIDMDIDVDLDDYLMFGPAMTGPLGP
ncbi:MAG: hypothetical protein JXB13_14735 [Phycisphaerae bacterium]|nr:hypothetical protein [Phycisphaerae bacterium]